MDRKKRSLIRFKVSEVIDNILGIDISEKNYSEISSLSLSATDKIIRIIEEEE